MLTFFLDNNNNKVIDCDGLLLSGNYFHQCLNDNKYNTLPHAANLRKRPEPKGEYYNERNISLSLSFYESMTIYLKCPASKDRLQVKNGKLFPSTLSGIAPNFFYRFHSPKVGTIYLILGTVFRNLLGMFIPKSPNGHEMLVLNWRYPQNILADITCNIQNQLKLTLDYEVDDKNIPNAQPTIITGINSNFGHTVFNELTGLALFKEHRPPPNKFPIKVGPYFLMRHPHTIFDIKGPEEQNSLTEFCDTINDSNLIPFSPVDFIIDDILLGELGRIKDNTPEEFIRQLKEIEPAAKTVIIAIPNDKWGTPYNLTKKILETIISLHQSFGNIAIIFDGWTRISDTIEERSKIEETNRKIIDITAQIPKNIPVLNVNGHDLACKLSAYSIATCYYSMFGSALTIPSWVYNLPGVSYGPRAIIEQPWLCLYSAGFFQHMTNTTLQIPGKLATHSYKTQYEFDNQWCIDRLKEILTKS